MLRSIISIAVAVITWWVVATIGNWILRAVLPGYSVVEVSLKFTLTMMICRLVLGLISSLISGLVGAAVARNMIGPTITAIVMLLLFVPVHYLLWTKFPIWYHLFFLITLAPTILLGAALRPKVNTSS